ncbi:MAG: hypothetical protein ABIH23_15565 [bacterium]
MAKSISITTLKNQLIRIKPNYTEDYTSYYSFALELQCVPVSEDNEEQPAVHIRELLGAPRETPYSLSELYGIIRETTTLHLLLSNKLKDMYVEAINEDPST